MNILCLYTVYKYPKDYPDKFVVRRWEINGKPQPENKEIVAVGEDLQEVRSKLPHGLCRIERQPEDDPVIVETWL